MLATNTAGLVGQDAQVAPDAALRVVGEIPAWLERASHQEDGTVTLTLFLDGVRQAIDRGDRLAIRERDSGQLLTTAIVTRDTRTVATSGRVHVRARLDEPKHLDRVIELAAARRADFPGQLAARNPFVKAHGASVTILLPFEPEKGDKESNFVRIVDKDTGKVSLDPDKVSPHASYEVSFNKPIDLATIRGLQMQAAHQAGTVPMRVLALDTEGKRFRLEPPLGLAFLPKMRFEALAAANGKRAVKRPHYRLQIAIGKKGVRAKDGSSYLQPFELGLRIDPTAKENIVAWRNFRVK